MDSYELCIAAPFNYLFFKSIDDEFYNSGMPLLILFL